MLEKQACQSQALLWQWRARASTLGTALGELQGSPGWPGPGGNRAHQTNPHGIVATHLLRVQADANRGRRWFAAALPTVIKRLRDYHTLLSNWEGERCSPACAGLL